MTTRKRDCLLKPKLTVRLQGKPEEEVPIDGGSALGVLHDIAKWVVDKTSDDHEETEEAQKS